MIKEVDVLFGFSSLRAVVLDLSSTGARVYFPSPQEMPDVVVLRLPDGAFHAACCKWRRDGEAGFVFLTTSPA
jgi:hypothetical protein